MAIEADQLEFGDQALVLERGKEVLDAAIQALIDLQVNLDDDFVAACEAILAAHHRVVVTGMGKWGHIARKIAATFAATGTPALYVHPAEAVNGDLGMITRDDVLLVLSNSGNTAELRAVLERARKLGVRIIGIVSRRESMVSDFADIIVCLPRLRKDFAADIAPTTSTTLQLALGDALAMAVMDMRGISRSQMRALRPTGTIGLRLTPIAELMHGREELPLVTAQTGMHDVISVITSSRFGLAGVTDEQGELVGVITDGDLRRNFDLLGSAMARDVMTRSPKSIPADTLAGDTLLYLNDHKITAIFVVDRLDLNRPIGIVHIHDLLKHGLDESLPRLFSGSFDSNGESVLQLGRSLTEKNSNSSSDADPIEFKNPVVYNDFQDNVIPLPIALAGLGVIFSLLSFGNISTWWGIAGVSVVRTFGATRGVN